MNRIRPVNPVAKALAESRRRASVVPNKKGKGSYKRNKLKSVEQIYKEIYYNNNK